ncbi:MAG TPA: DUF4287 domain-containing protein [Candidatus Limnocylindria bacterium]|nr:DUF4287 domain-containing protein [Candidatus Limnocylindria bacterium]
MSVHHSDETYANLVARLPQATGRDIKEWCKEVENGPSMSRPEDRIHWLQDTYELPHSYAKAIVHEYDMQRAARRVT